MLPLCILRSLVLAVLLLPSIAGAVPLEVYGRLPSLSSVAVSPDGSKLAFVRTTNEIRAIGILNLADKKLLGGLTVGDVKFRSLQWADDDHVVLVTSTTQSVFDDRFHEFFQLQVYSVAGHKSVAVPNTGHDPFLLPATWGSVSIRRVRDHALVIATGFQRRFGSLLIRYDVDTGEETHEEIVEAHGAVASSKMGIALDAAGAIVADVIYDNWNRKWTVRLRRGDEWTAALEGKDDIDIAQVQGFGPTDETVLVHVHEGQEWHWRLVSRKDGSTVPGFDALRDAEGAVQSRLDSRTIGAFSVGDTVQYRFFDPARQSRWEAVLRAFPDAIVRFASASDNFKQLVVRVESPRLGYAYHLVDFEARKSTWIGDVYDSLTEPLEVRRITYPAADGLAVPAYLTLPRKLDSHRLPLVVLPHELKNEDHWLSRGDTRLEMLRATIAFLREHNPPD